MHVYQEPADLFIGEVCVPCEFDGQEVVVADWGDSVTVLRKDAAVDMAHGILFMANEPTSHYDKWGLLRGVVLVTGLTTYAWLLWRFLNFLYF